jgi:PAS domain S-box-containing protein
MSKAKPSKQGESEPREALRPEPFWDKYPVFRSVLDSLTDGVVLADEHGNLISNPAAKRILAAGHPEAQQRDWPAKYGLFLSDRVTPYPPDRLPLARALRGETVADEPVFIRNSGVPKGRWTSLNASPLRDSDGRIRGAVLVLRDATEVRRAQDALQRARDWSSAILDTVGSLVVVLDRSGRIVSFNRGCEVLTGYSFDEVRGKPFWDLFLVPEERESVRRVFDQLRAGYFPNRHENHWKTRDGARRLIAWSNTAILDDHGLVEYVVGTGVDITERKQAEEELRRANEMLEVIMRSSPIAIWAIDTGGNVRFWNPAAERLHGWTEEEVLGRPLPAIDEEEREDHLSLLERARNGETLIALERQRKRKDGKLVDVSLSMVPLRGAAGGVEGYIAFVTDVTESKQVEDQLRQSQKMEAMGRLAGVVAHDFNNLLTVISGYGQILLGGLNPADPMRGDMQEILKAADSAAELTGQLLAFSRRQIIQPAVVDFNALIRNMDRMLRRVIREDIQLTYLLGSEVGKVKADPGQIGQVLVNLVVNARDAMPAGGKLTIETSPVYLDEEYARTHVDVQPGPYVMLTVSDTGTGMDEETRRHLFEPFFTTKEKGKGTGLGLSTAYGIIKQSGGDIRVYTEPERGTSFKIYLPVVEGPEPEASLARPAVQPGTETILIAEDEPGLRRLIRQVLEQQGYTVLQAPDSETALEICRNYRGPVHLLLTDVVMPGMSGKELAQKVVESMPGVKVLYMSGYTDNVIVHHGVLDEGIAFLQKPFTPDVLARKIREVLDEPKPE